MSAAKKHRSADKEERRERRRRRKVAAATSTMLLVAAAVAGEPIGLAAGPTHAAAGVGGGLFGMTDPDDVSANGEVGEDDEIGTEVLESAGNIDRLLGLGAQGDLPNGPLGIPSDMAKAYRNAANMLAVEQPNCKLHWSLLASIGRIESNHARGGRVDAAGTTVPHILGPVLNGGGFAAIQDTDDGRLDGDSRWDRAVGAMQFIPSTWRGYASDGNNDGVSSPHNVWDATLAAGKYLCSGGMDLSDKKDVMTAVFRYNHSDSYVATVMVWAEAYRAGVPLLPSDPVDYSPGNQAMGPPPVVGPGLGANKPKPPANKPPASKPPGTTTTRTTTTTTTSSSTTSSTSSSTTTSTTTTTVPCPPTSTTTTTESTTTTTTEPPAEPTTTTTTTTTPTSTTTTTTTTTTEPCS